MLFLQDFDYQTRIKYGQKKNVVEETVLEKAEDIPSPHSACSLY